MQDRAKRSVGSRAAYERRARGVFPYILQGAVCTAEALDTEVHVIVRRLLSDLNGTQCCSYFHYLDTPPVVRDSIIEQ